jgi:protein gp37
MADRSAIEWTDATWNPIRARNRATGKIGWHCEHATTGCEFCYAEGFNKRLGTGLPFKPGHRDDIEIFLDEEMLTLPLRWKKPRMIFVCSMTDLFADFVPDEWIDKMFAVMALTPQHTYQVLTKRAARMRDYFCSDPRWRNRQIVVARNGVAGVRVDFGPMPSILPLPNVWLGVSTERQQEADERIPLLLQTPAAVRFSSAEPLLGPIDLTQSIYHGEAGLSMRGFLRNRNEPDDFHYHAAKLDQVIAGGESGPKARPVHPDWIRSLRDQCQAAGASFFFKQWGEWAPVPLSDTAPRLSETMGFGKHRFPFRQFMDVAMVRFGKKRAGRLLDGVEHNDFPTKGAGNGL